MFCEKCGNQMPEGTQFCEKCGTPVAGAAQDAAASAAPAENAAPAAPVTAAADGAQAPVQGDPQTMNYAAAPAPAPRQPLSPKAKKAILFGSIGAGVLAALLIVLFVVIIPAVKRAKEEAAKIDITKYLTVKINDNGEDSEDSEDTENAKTPTVIDGYIDGYITWDVEKFKKDTNWGDNKPYSAETFFNSITNYLTLEVRKGDEDPTSSTSFDNASADTTFKVTVKWPSDMKDEETSESNSFYKAITQSQIKQANEEISSREAKCGVVFKHSKKTKTLELGKELKDKGITVNKPTEADLLSYIKDNNLIIQSGNKSGRLRVTIGKFKTELNGYTFSKEDDDTYTDIKIYDSNNEYIGDVDLDFSDSSYLDDGTTVTLDYDSYSKEKYLPKGLKLTGSAISYTVKAPEPFTLESAKANVEALKTYFNENIKEEDYDASETDTVVLNNIYFCQEKDGDDAYVVFVYNNSTDKTFNTAKFNAEDVYMKDGALVNEGNLSLSYTTSKTLEEAVKNNYYLGTASKYYTNTKLL